MRTLWLWLAGLIAAPLPAAEPDAGQAAYAAGDYVGAIERWQAQVVAEGATAGRLAALGNAEWKLGRKGRAMVCWERALLLAQDVQTPDDGVARDRVGVLERQLFQLDTDAVTADVAGQGRVDVARLAGDALALGLVLDEMQRPHVVQTVGELDQ